MLKKYTDKVNNMIKLHVAGTTIRHENGFSDLAVLINSKELCAEFRENM
jgi:hypothetical protein